MLNEIFRYIVKREAYRGYRGLIVNPFSLLGGLFGLIIYFLLLLVPFVFSYTAAGYIGPFSTFPIFFFLASHFFFIKHNLALLQVHKPIYGETYTEKQDLRYKGGYKLLKGPDKIVGSELMNDFELAKHQAYHKKEIRNALLTMAGTFVLIMVIFTLKIK